MKAKINEIPLVGPRGRKELLERIVELESAIKEINKSENSSTAPALMIIHGTVGVTGFTPSNGEDIKDAIAHIKAGGILYLVIGTAWHLACSAETSNGNMDIRSIPVSGNSGTIVWHPDQVLEPIGGGSTGPTAG